jgi:hypothetical protein
MLRIYTKPTPFLSLTFRAKISSRASAQLLQTSSLSTVRFFFSIDPSTDPSIHRSIELCVVSFNVPPHQMSASSLAFSTRENMHFRSTASTDLRNSLLTLRSRRPFEPVFFFFFVLLDEISERTVTLR